MNSKKRTLKIIDSIYWGFILILTIIKFINALKNGELLDFFEISTNIKELILIFLALILCFISSILTHFKILLLYIGIRIACKKFYKEKFTKVDFKNNNYYRDIISKYSPAMLSYIDDFNLDKSDIVATLMNLQLKQKIAIEDSIIVIDDNEENLDENEVYILNRIKYNDLKNIDINVFQNKVIDDCIKNKLLEAKTPLQEIFKKHILLCVSVLITIIIVSICLPVITTITSNTIIFLILLFFQFFCFFILPPVVIVYIITYCYMNKKDPYIRNKNAEYINEKLEGLRKYLKDYSLLDQKGHEAMAMWEDYLIYSVILGQNTKIVDEIMEKINKM